MNFVRDVNDYYSLDSDQFLYLYYICCEYINELYIFVTFGQSIDL